MMFFPTVSFTFLLVRVLCNAALSDSFPAAIIGTYNVTFVIVGVPSESAYSLVPAKYREVRAILPPDLAQFPALATEELPVFLELGREADAGPPFLSFESFQEAKIEVPNVKRVDNSSPFLYKRLIGKIANLVPIPASRYLFRRIAVTARTTIMLYRTCWMQLSGKYLKKKLDTLFPRIKASELESTMSILFARNIPTTSPLLTRRSAWLALSLYTHHIQVQKQLHLLRSVAMPCEVYILSRSLALSHAPYSCKHFVFATHGGEHPRTRPSISPFNQRLSL
ncbi:hypothetical protein WG66_005853 [Moniliophthora roreri]|nr:hypothetical protein WG66_005853 [Moniliophthora roreri]